MRQLFTVRLVRRPALMLVIAAMVAAVAGCAGMQIKPERRIDLVAGAEQRGTDQTPEYVMKYLYRYERADAVGSGSVTLKADIGILARLKYLSIAVNWLDADGNVLDSNVFYSSGQRKKYRSLGVEETFKVPAGTRSMAFTSLYRRWEGK